MAQNESAELTVPFLSRDEIEARAFALLTDYFEKSATRFFSPIPVEALLEKHLKLTLGFDDLHQRFDAPRRNEPDILGALWA